MYSLFTNLFYKGGYLALKKKCSHDEQIEKKNTYLFIYFLEWGKQRLGLYDFT